MCVFHSSEIFKLLYLWALFHCGHFSLWAFFLVGIFPCGHFSLWAFFLWASFRESLFCCESDFKLIKIFVYNLLYKNVIIKSLKIFKFRINFIYCILIFNFSDCAAK